MRQVADGVAKDMDELNESFQNMLNEEGEEYSGATFPTQQGTRKSPSASREEQIGESSNIQSQASREEVLQRLQGQDTQLEAGLKVNSA